MHLKSKRYNIFIQSDRLFGDRQFMGFNVCMRSCNRHCNQDTAESHVSKNPPTLPRVITLIRPNPWPPLLFSPSLEFAFPRMSNKWDHSGPKRLRPAPSAQHDAFAGHPSGCVCRRLVPVDGRAVGIPSYGCTTVCLSIHPSKDMLVVSSVWQL